MNMHKPEFHNKANAWAAAAVIAALSAVSCTHGLDTDPDNLSHDGENSVMFGAYISNANETRASVLNINSLKQAGFGVFASTTGEENFNPDASGNFTPDFMYNQKVKWKAAASGAPGAGTWSYEPPQVWPDSKVSFFAYAPYTAAAGETGIAGIPDKGTSGSPKLAFRMASDVDSQIDLLYADAAKTVDLKKSDPVQFQFKHALSRIGFRCATDETVDISTTVTVNSVTLKSSALSVSGELNLYTAEWESLTAEEMEYTLGTDDFKTGSNVITKADGTAVSDLTSNGKYLMIIPSNETVPVEITVHYDIETSDANLDTGKIKISNELTQTLDFNFKTGKAYWFTLRLGIKSVKISAGVSDWEEYETDWTPIEKP